jgi:hypothetical protein
MFVPMLAVVVPMLPVGMVMIPVVVPMAIAALIVPVIPMVMAVLLSRLGRLLMGVRVVVPTSSLLWRLVGRPGIDMRVWMRMIVTMPVLVVGQLPPPGVILNRRKPTE